MSGVAINHCSNVLPRCSTDSSKWESRKVGMWKIRTGHLGNARQFTRLWHRISPELMSCVLCVNQPLFKFTTKMRYSRFEAEKWASGQAGNLKQFSGLQEGIWGGICSPEPMSCVLCVNQPLFKFAAKMQYSQFEVG
jgi:hypothetical protein